MNLWLYSSGGGRENTDADTDLVGEMRTLRPRLTFIAASSEDGEDYYDEFIERFGSYGYKNFNMIAADRPLNPTDVARAFTSDLIYLSGGNTFHFLKHARETGLLRELKRYVAMGGRLAGHSAGAILLTPSIDTASFPEFDRDDNLAGLTDLRALGFVSFEIFPHYPDESAYDAALTEASLHRPHPLYALDDGGCIHVSNRRLSFYGSITLFSHGKKTTIR